jgi:hypothetical protein
MKRMSKAVVVVQFIILAFGNRTEDDHEQPHSFFVFVPCINGD